MRKSLSHHVLRNRIIRLRLVLVDDIFQIRFLSEHILDFHGGLFKQPLAFLVALQVISKLVDELGVFVLGSIAFEFLDFLIEFVSLLLLPV